MANIKSAAKRARQTVRITAANRSALSLVKSRLKKVRTALKEGKKAEATEAARAFISIIDKAAKTGRVPKNRANRHKARINKAVAALS